MINSTDEGSTTYPVYGHGLGVPIHRYIYPYFLRHENPKTAHKNAQKMSANFKPCILNVDSSGTNSQKYGFPCVPIGCVKFARNCGKMYTAIFFCTVDSNKFSRRLRKKFFFPVVKLISLFTAIFKNQSDCLLS